MPLIYNGTTLTDIVYNGVALDKVIYNGVTVFEKISNREPASGEYYNTTAAGSLFYFGITIGTLQKIYWNGVNIYPSTSPALSWSDGTWTYYRGNLNYNTTNTKRYGIYRVKN